MVTVITPDRSIPTDTLRPPSPLDLLARAHKDWLHLNVFVPSGGIVAIVNTSLHGDPVSPASLTSGTVVVHHDRIDAVCDVRTQHDPTVAIDARSIDVGGRARIALGDGAFLTARARVGDITIDVACEPWSEPIEVETPVPFGSGWIAWRAVPRLRVGGELTIDGRGISLDDAIGYHDHNWGRWYWGDDIGWRWGTFPASGHEVTVTVAHRTDRAHRTGAPIARVQIGPIARDYPQQTVTVEYAGRLDGPILRLPGAMAALRNDRQRPDLPERVRVTVSDGFDHLEVDFHVVEAMQLITSDPARPGQTFIHELIGRFEVRGRFKGRPVDTGGLGVFEHVD